MTATGERRIAVRLFFFLTFAYWLTMGAGPRTVDEWNVYWVAESLWQRGDLAMPQVKQAGIFYGKWGRGGKFYSPYEVLPSILAAPLEGIGFYLTKDSASKVFPVFVPGTLACSLAAPVTAATAALLFLTLTGIAFTRVVALGTVFIFAFGTLAWPYSAYLFREPYAGLFLLMTAYLLLGWRREGHPSLCLWAGVAAALGFACKREVFVILPGLSLLFLLKGEGELGAGKARLRAFFKFIEVPLLALVLQLAWNAWRFGDPWEMGIPDLDETGKPMVAFGTPLLTGLYGFLLSPGKGLIFFNPPLLLAIPGFWALRKRLQVETLAILAGTLTGFVFYSRWIHWEGGWCWGTRFAVPWIPLLMVGVAGFWESVARKGRWWRPRLLCAAWIIAWGLAAQILGVFVDWLTYAFQAGTYIKNLNEYQMDFNPWWGHAQLLRLSFRQWFSGGVPEFDLWQCFFLREGGSPAIIWGLTGILAACTAASGLSLYRAAMTTQKINPSAP